jgi:hypothetical protein
VESQHHLQQYQVPQLLDDAWKAEGAAHDKSFD